VIVNRKADFFYKTNRFVIRIANRNALSNISKWCVLGTKLLMNTNRKSFTQSIEWYHFQWPSFTSDPDFKVTTFFEVDYRKTGASWRQSYYCTRGNSNIWDGTVWWPWLTSKRVAWVCQHQLSFIMHLVPSEEKHGFLQK